MNTAYIIIGIGVLIGIIIVFGRRRSSSQVNLPHNATDDDIRLLLQQGKKIQAIKLYRVLYKVDLKESKKAVEERMKHMKL